MCFGGVGLKGGLKEVELFFLLDTFKVLLAFAGLYSLFQPQL